MRALKLALQFHTRLPLKAGKAPSAKDLGRAVGWFPLVGLLMGLVLMLLHWAMMFDSTRLHDEAAAFVLVLLWAWMGGSLHLDGLADTLDGLASGKSGKQMLAVMHDHASGAFGVVGLVLALLAKFVFIDSLPNGLVWYLPLPLVAGRLTQTLLCTTQDYAGKPGSLGAPFVNKSTDEEAWLGLSLAIGSLVLLGLIFGWGLGHWAFAQVVATDWLSIGLAPVAMILGIAFGWWMSQAPIKRLAGLTGDVCGYASEMAEIATALLLLAGLVR
jgi:adenosylcobinamide-GDP ribazoletransferase